MTPKMKITMIQAILKRINEGITPMVVKDVGRLSLVV
jgi:hypothetical protein